MKKFKFNYISLFYFSTLLIFLFSLVILTKSEEFLIFFFILFGLLLFYYFSHKNITIFILVSFSFVIKLIILYFLTSHSLLHYFPDSINYLNNLNVLLDYGKLDFSTISSVVGTIHVGFYYFYLPIYSIVQNELTILFINTLITSISLILLFHIVNKRFNYQISLVTVILGACSMNLYFFGSYILKDPLVLFLTMLSLYFYIYKNNIYISILISFIIFPFRIYAGASILLAILFDYIFVKKLFKFSLKIKQLPIIIILFLILSFFIDTSLYMNMISSFLKSYNIMEFPIALIIGISNFYFSPAPWNFLNLENIYKILVIDSLFFYIFIIFLFLFILKFFKYKELRENVYIFIIPIFIHALALGLEYGGGSVRQRLGIFLFLILLYVLGALYKNTSQEGRNE